MTKNRMTKIDASSIRSSQAKAGRDMSSSGFAARVQAAGDKSTNAQNNNAGGAQQAENQGAGSGQGQAGGHGHGCGGKK